MVVVALYSWSIDSKIGPNTTPYHKVLQNIIIFICSIYRAAIDSHSKGVIIKKKSKLP